MERLCTQDKPSCACFSCGFGLSWDEVARCILKRLSVSRGLGAGKQCGLWTATSGAASSLPAPACWRSLHWEGRQALSSGGRGPAPSRGGDSQGEGIPEFPEGLSCSFPQDLTHPEPLQAMSQPGLAPPVPFAFGMTPVLAPPEGLNPPLRPRL